MYHTAVGFDKNKNVKNYIKQPRQFVGLQEQNNVRLLGINKVFYINSKLEEGC